MTNESSSVLGAIMASAFMSGLSRDDRPRREPRDITHVVTPEKQNKRAKRRAKGKVQS